MRCPLESTIDLRHFYYDKALKLGIWLCNNPTADPEKRKAVETEKRISERKCRHFARNAKNMR